VGWVGWGGVGAAEGEQAQRQGAIEKWKKKIVKKRKKSRKNNLHNNPHHVRDRCICSYFAKNL
jgi:hypothetical protein